MRHGFAFALFASVTVAVACSRNANQNNLLHAKCATTADCPSPDNRLICYQGTCEDGCASDADCRGGTTCRNSVCSSGGGGTKLPGGDGGTADEPAAGDGGGPPGQTFDGTTLQSHLPYVNSNHNGIAVGEGHVAWVESASDAIGGSTLTLKVAADTPGATPVTLFNQPSGLSAATIAKAIHGGKVYWTNAPPNPNTFSYASFDGTGTGTLPISSAPGSLEVFGNYLYYAEGGGRSTSLKWVLLSNNSLGTAGPMSNAAGGSVFSGSDTTVMWLGTSTGTNPLPIMKSTFGASGGTDTGATVSATAQVAGSGVVGNIFYFLGESQGSTTLAKIDTSLGSGATAQVVKAGIQGGGYGNAYFDQTYVYMGVSSTTAGGGTNISRFALSNGDATVVARTSGRAESIYVSGSKIYWMEDDTEPSTTGMAAGTVRIASKALP